MQPQSTIALSLNNVAALIKAVGTQRTVLVQGHMGTGKSSLLRKLVSDKSLANHQATYFDCTTKDLGDIALPKLDGAEGCVRFLPNEELGVHHGRPVILMIDEFGKANPSVKNALMRVMLERNGLPEGSIVFATTNMSSEGVGDLLLPHHRNRIIVVRSAKPTAEEWILDFAVPNNLHPTVIAWAHENPCVFDSFEEHEKPESNPYIYHPRAQRDAFVTPRSLHAASDIMWAAQRSDLTPETLRAALVGAIGLRGGMDLEAYVTLFQSLPKQEEIQRDPKGAPLPENGPTQVMLVYRALGNMTPEFFTPWFTYLQRMPTELQAMFAVQALAPTYPHRALVATSAHSRPFLDWAREHGYLFTASK